MADNLHAGHRERMRNKYLKNGIEAFEPHEVLEMLLFYTRAQGNTNPLAHELIDRFGSLDGVLNATCDELKQVNGMGEHSAILISLVGSIQTVCKLQQNPMPKDYKNTKKLFKFLSSYYENKREEEAIVILYDNMLRNNGLVVVGKGIANRANVDYQRAFQAAISRGSPNILLIHNHPKGSAIPSDKDIRLTMTIRDKANSLGLHLLDHIIVGENEIISFRSTKKYMGYV